MYWLEDVILIYNPYNVQGNVYSDQKVEISQILGVERNTIMYFVDFKGSKPHPRWLGTAKPV